MRTCDLLNSAGNRTQIRAHNWGQWTTGCNCLFAPLKLSTDSLWPTQPTQPGQLLAYISLPVVHLTERQTRGDQSHCLGAPWPVVCLLEHWPDLRVTQKRHTILTLFLHCSSNSVGPISATSHTLLCTSGSFFISISSFISRPLIECSLGAPHLRIVFMLLNWSPLRARAHQSRPLHRGGECGQSGLVRPQKVESAPLS